MKRLAGQFGRFGVVGILATGVHAGVVVALVELAGLDPVTANFPAFATAVLVSYAGNRLWTFGAAGRHRVLLPRFAAVAVAGFLLNHLLLSLMVDRFGIDYRQALPVVVLVVPLLSFLLNRIWVFGAPRSGGSALR